MFGFLWLLFVRGYFLPCAIVSIRDCGGYCNVKCGMWNVKCGMWNVECGMWNELL